MVPVVLIVQLQTTSTLLLVSTLVTRLEKMTQCNTERELCGSLVNLGSEPSDTTSLLTDNCRNGLILCCLLLTLLFIVH